KPVHGTEPALAANLAALFAQDYPGPVQIIFGTRNPDDPALAVIAAARKAYPTADIDIVISDRRWGANNKLSNLANMDEVGRHPLVVIADSDVDWTPDTLRRLAGA
ncbi:glycosyltransferase, partial [Sphingomonas sp.]|uniref:glycosyltransferase n=1 Tax=Sphingomonas sp. TaxID=28214 RepID=UPI0035A8AB41